jgi:hypothetical protein
VSLSKGTERTDTTSHGGLDYDRHTCEASTNQHTPKGGSLRHLTRFSPSPSQTRPVAHISSCEGSPPSPTRPVAHFLHTLIVTRGAPLGRNSPNMDHFTHTHTTWLTSVPTTASETTVDLYSKQYATGRLPPWALIRSTPRA